MGKKTAKRPLILRDTPPEPNEDKYVHRNTELGDQLQGDWAAKKIKMIERFPDKNSTAWRAIEE